MSDGVQIAFVTGGLASFTTLAAIVLNHFLGRRDRLLANQTVGAKNTEIETLKSAHAREIEDLRMKYNSDVNTLQGALTVCQSKLNAYMGQNP